MFVDCLVMDCSKDSMSSHFHQTVVQTQAGSRAHIYFHMQKEAESLAKKADKTACVLFISA